MKSEKKQGEISAKLINDGIAVEVHVSSSAELLLLLYAILDSWTVEASKDAED